MMKQVAMEIALFLIKLSQPVLIVFFSKVSIFLQNKPAFFLVSDQLSVFQGNYSSLKVIDYFFVVRCQDNNSAKIVYI